MEFPKNQPKPPTPQPTMPMVLHALLQRVEQAVAEAVGVDRCILITLSASSSATAMKLDREFFFLVLVNMVQGFTTVQGKVVNFN